MRTALLFRDSVEIEVRADQVRDGVYSKFEDFVDPEYRFRVVYVKDSKGHTGPYFRLYFSRDYYLAMTPERKSQYDILRDQRHFLESKWHRHWEEKLSSFCEIEHLVSNPKGERKRADAFYLEGKTVIEVQHSFIAKDFELRNAFYSELGYNIIWLYDLTMMNAVEKEGGLFEILENNAKGFFRIAESSSNLEDYPVFVQVAGGSIFRVSKLGRKNIQDTRQSTIRFFVPDARFSEESFIEGLKALSALFLSKAYVGLLKPKGNSIPELWNKNFSKMVVEDIWTKNQIVVFGDSDGCMRHDFNDPSRIRVSYVTFNEKTGKWTYNAVGTFYSISIATQKEKKWRLLASVPKEGGQNDC